MAQWKGVSLPASSLLVIAGKSTGAIMVPEPVTEVRKSPIPAAWKSVKGAVTTGILRRPTTPTDGGPRPVTPTSELDKSIDILCDESTAASARKQAKSVRPKSSRRKVIANVDTGCGMSVSSAESRAKRIERSRKRVESDRKKTRNHLQEYSGSPQHSSRRRDRSRSQSRSPVVDQVKVVHKRTKKRSSPQRKSQQSHVVSPHAVDLGDTDVPLNPIRPDSRMSQFADTEEEEITIADKNSNDEEPQKKSVKWHSAVKSCSDSYYDDDITEDGTVSCIIN